MLPIPDRPAPGLTTYDAKDPETSYPPIEPLLPPPGAPNVLIVLLYPLLSYLLMQEIGCGFSRYWTAEVISTGVSARLRGSRDRPVSVWYRCIAFSSSV